MAENTILHLDGGACPAQLGQLRMFRGCTAAEIELYLRSFGAAVRKMGKGEIVVHEGAKIAWTMIVLQGTLELYDTSGKGNRILVRVFEPGGFLGMSLSMQPLTDYYPCMIIAGADTEVLTLDVAKVHSHWYEPEFKKFYTNLFRCFTNYVRFCRDKFEILNLRNAEDRIHLYLRQRANELGTKEFTVPFVNSQQMADFLGITRVSLSRSLAALVRAGKIARFGKRAATFPERKWSMPLN